MCRPFFRKQRRHRQSLFPRIADVPRQVGIRQFLRFDHDMERIRRTESPILLPHRKCLHDVQHLQRRDALPVRRQFIDRPIAIGGGDGFHPFAGELRQVPRHHRPAVAFHRIQNLCRNFSFVKCISPVLRDLLERPGQIRIAKHFPYFRRMVSRQIRLRCRFICPKVIDGCCPVGSRPFRHRKSVLCCSNRRRQVFSQFFSPKPVRKLLPSVHGSGNGDGIHALLRHAPNSLLL